MPKLNNFIIKIKRFELKSALGKTKTKQFLHSYYFRKI
ncbi:hypothetical protein LEP1GSC059_4701 [Leptospira noguchii serovar Panama str. CZ214]|uniref:Uncharacterized protein n=1 Tax=Leptospira noguchii serovar Panama str. CZ214 TaxID=1001595 RepID=T0GTL7_9LEPT|nr:hypothetical protein LEP1GSC059_4701 [Leptospira noguchii serovar Panama str. CZ214]